MKTRIGRDLPNNQYQAALNANAPSASNPFLTSADIAGLKAYGSFYADGNGALAVQTPTGIGVDDYMKLDTTVVSSNVLLLSATQIRVVKAGVYNIQFSAQINKTSGSSDVLSIWLDVNGLPVDNTNTKITLANNNHLAVAAWNFMVPLTANAVIRLGWSTTAGHIFLNGSPGIGIGGAVPPIIITVQEV